MDLNIKCSDCHKTFVFTEGESKFYKQLVAEGNMDSFTLPKRCKNCRDAKKARFDKRQSEQEEQ